MKNIKHVDPYIRNKHDVNNIGDMILFYFDVPLLGSNVHNLFRWNFVKRRLQSALNLIVDDHVKNVV